jgi:3-oxoacyl-(acyl-carrier-protein) synthase/acyl carrier protein
MKHKVNHISFISDLLEIIEEVTGFSSIGPNDPIMDNGIDSMQGVEFVNIVNERFALDLSDTFIFDYPTLNHMNEYLINNCTSSETSETSETNNLNQSRSDNDGRIITHQVNHISFISGLLEIIEEVTGFSSIGPNDPIMDNGIDSMQGVEFVNIVNERFVLDLSDTFIFDYPTLNHMNEYLINNCTSSETSETSETNNLNQSRSDNDGRIITHRVKTGISNKVYITGMAGRFPGSDTIEGFWDNITNGKDCVDREQGIGRFVDRTLFDAQFFRMPKNEAIITDPAHRITLEVVHEAMVDADLDHATEKDVGVFLGQCFQDYDIVAARTQTTGVYHSVANARSVLAGRISFHYDFKAPCMTIDTACSSSLVCLDLALMNMQQGRCNKALVGGVNVVIDPTTTEMFRTTNMLSPDYACKTFDDSANGYVRSEGCGIVVLEKEAKHGAYAVVRGTGVNHDGRTATLTAPNGPSQEAVYRQTLSGAGLLAEDIDAIECHGTGTPLGDPIEVNSLKNVYCVDGRTKPLWLGSVKSCIGHTEAAAGIAGVIKACLMLNRGVVAPVVHFQKKNHHIQLADCMKIPKEVVVLDDIKNVAVSSFGFSGTNAHAILGRAENTKTERVDCFEWKTKQRYWIDNTEVPVKMKKKKRVIRL